MQDIVLAEWHDLPFHPVANILPLIDGAEFDALVADIRRNGLLEPIWLHATEDSIVDGRNRYRACIACGATPRFRRWDGNGSLVGFVLSLNVYRRQLTSSQRAAVAVDALPMLEAEAKERQLSTLKQNADSPLPKNLGNGGTDDDRHNSEAAAQAAKMVGTNRTYVARAKALKQDRPDLYAEVAAGRLAIDKAAKQHKRENERERRLAEADAAPTWPDWLVVGDFRTRGAAVPDGSIDLIFTDPPYDKESAALYGDLAAFAARVLKPGGVCIAYSGQMHLPDIYHAMSLHLNYMWTCAIGHSGGSTYFRKWHMNNLWKPLLMYGRGSVVAWWRDAVDDWTSGGKEKGVHPWQQAQGEAEHFIAALCPPGGTVCDPFAGGGTTLAAAKALGRNYLGFEIDAATAVNARRRVEGAA